MFSQGLEKNTEQMNKAVLACFLLFVEHREQFVFMCDEWGGNGIDLCPCSDRLMSADVTLQCLICITL